MEAGVRRYPQPAMIRIQMHPRRTWRGVMKRVCSQRSSTGYRNPRKSISSASGATATPKIIIRYAPCGFWKNWSMGKRLRNGQQPRKLSQGHGQKGACRQKTQPAQIPRPMPTHRLPERTLLVTRHQPIHGHQHGEVGQRHARHDHQRPGILAQLGGETCRARVSYARR